MSAQRIIIVGASSGIGKELAIGFLEKGWKVGLASRNVASLKDICDKYEDRASLLQSESS